MMTSFYLLISINIIIVATWIISIIFRKEIKAVFERDPAATNFLEVIFTYSGFHAIVFYSIAHTIKKFSIPVIPRLISQISRIITGIEIHPGAVIGRGLFIDHGMGVVIGETSVIGNNVTLFQGVTLGGTGKEKGKRHPTIGNNVVIGAGAKVLGDIVIGDNVQIGANAVVVRDVAPNSTVVGVPGRVARHKGRRFPGINLDHTGLPDPLAERLEKLQEEIDSIEIHMKEYDNSK